MFLNSFIFNIINLDFFFLFSCNILSFYYSFFRVLNREFYLDLKSFYSFKLYLTKNTLELY